MSDKTGKIIKTISLDNTLEIAAHIEKQPNFSSYMQTLMLQDIARLKQEQLPQRDIEKITLTKDEQAVFNHSLKYFREYGGLKYSGYYPYFPIQTDPELLRCMLLDVEDICRGYSLKIAEYIKHLRENEADYNSFYDKISNYWLQENPVPEEWKTEIIPGLTLHEALSKIIPVVLGLKYHDLPITIRRISEASGLTYQQAYTQLMPHIKPILKQLQVDV